MLTHTHTSSAYCLQLNNAYSLTILLPCQLQGVVLSQLTLSILYGSKKNLNNFIFNTTIYAIFEHMFQDHFWKFAYTRLRKPSSTSATTATMATLNSHDMSFKQTRSLERLPIGRRLLNSGWVIETSEWCRSISRFGKIA